MAQVGVGSCPAVREQCRECCCAAGVGKVVHETLRQKDAGLVQEDMQPGGLEGMLRCMPSSPGPLSGGGCSMGVPKGERASGSLCALAPPSMATQGWARRADSRPQQSGPTRSMRRCPEHVAAGRSLCVSIGAMAASWQLPPKRPGRKCGRLRGERGARQGCRVVSAQGSRGMVRRREEMG